VINFEWNQAADYIDGFDEPMYQHPHHPRNVSISKLPHNIFPASAKHMTYKPIQFDDIH